MKAKNYASLLALLLTMLGLGLTQSAQAQITSVSAVAHAYSSSYCTIPAYVELSVYGTVTGPFSGTDTLTATFYYGDGTSEVRKMPVGMFGGAIIDSFGTGQMHTYTLAGTYTTMVVVTAPSGVSDTAYTTAYTISNTCGNISGHIYLDANNNCNYDSGEALLNGLLVKATNTTTGAVHYSTITSMGHYDLNVPSGFTYTLTTVGWLTGLAPTCPTGGSASVGVAVSGSYTQDFGFQCGTAGPDMLVYASANNFRPGFTRPLWVVAHSNEICPGTPATISLTLPALTSYASTLSGPAPAVSGSTLTWHVSSLSAWSSFTAMISIYTDPSAVIGDSACVNVTIVPVGATDPDMSDNTYNVCIPINNSYDPNDKLVAPRGIGGNGLIPVNTAFLTYRINFQNTGNDTAYNVTIKDQLDSDLDPASVHVTGSSHPYTATIAGGNELQFRFSGIMLPDSNVNEPASHGYVVYQARLKPSIASDATINNTANIYFDYNDAIVTNTTVNTLYMPASVQNVQSGKLNASVYPNPASDKVMVQVEGQVPFTATLRDITGRQVAQAGGVGTAPLNVRALPNGIYQLSIQSGKDILQTKVVLAR